MGSPRDIRESQILAMQILYIVGSVLAAQAAAEAEPKANPNAEANADPWYSYGYGLGHRYGGYGHHGYAAYRPHYGGYGYWGRKKRDAEAEPVADATAEADADPWYSAYGSSWTPWLCWIWSWIFRIQTSILRIWRAQRIRILRKE